jgi:DHA2 family multidrug resistance protein-like MFS transporter
MILGIALLGTGVLLLAQTWVLPVAYLVVTFVGFPLFGVGLGFFATPAVDIAMTNEPLEKAGVAGGLFKMASSLGASMGVCDRPGGGLRTLAGRRRGPDARI